MNKELLANIAAHAFVFLLFLASIESFAHGKVSLFECYNPGPGLDNGELVVRIEKDKSAKSDGFNMRLLQKKGKKPKELSAAKIEIRDEILEGKIIEKIEVQTSEAVLKLTIPEIYAHKIRRGIGELSLEGSNKSQKINSCFLIYQD